MGERLDDRDVGAEGLPDTGELDPDDTAAEHDRPRRDPVQPQGVVAADDPVAVDGQTGQRLGLGSGGEQDVSAGECLLFDLNGGGGGEHSLAGDVGDVLGFDQALQAGVQFAGDAVLVLVHTGHVDAGQLGGDPELTAFPGAVGDLGGVQQRLGGDAAAVQAGTAEQVLLDQGDGLSEFCGA